MESLFFSLRCVLFRSNTRKLKADRTLFWLFLCISFNRYLQYHLILPNNSISMASGGIKVSSSLCSCLCAGQ
jgi:hypothetical protein